MLDAGNNESTDIKTKFSLLMKVSYNDFDARVGTSESLMLTTIISSSSFFFLMVHCVPHDDSSNIQKIEEVLGISQKSNKSLTTHSNIHGSYCNKKSVCIIHPIYVRFLLKKRC